MVAGVALPDSTYARLLALRTGLRRFERWSAQQARTAGLTPAQHQLLLAIRGHTDPAGPTIGEVADYLLLRHHSTVELVDRAEAAGLVSRTRSTDDHRVVHLQLTATGASRLEALAALHLEELERLALDVPAAWAGLDPTQPPHGLPGSAGRAETGAVNGSGVSTRVGVARVYDRAEPGTERLLVDGLWPRGISRRDAPFDSWVKDLAPSTELRKWYGHAPERFDQFSRRYRRELTRPPGRDALTDVRRRSETARIVLVTATKDLEHSAAAVLQDVIGR
jgi:uncharacterized protein YeaO (DUF488 family)/DNA-binding MarR family transcriptional regulator